MQAARTALPAHIMAKMPRRRHLPRHFHHLDFRSLRGHRSLQRSRSKVSHSPLNAYCQGKKLPRRFGRASLSKAVVLCLHILLRGLLETEWPLPGGHRPPPRGASARQDSLLHVCTGQDPLGWRRPPPSQRSHLHISIDRDLLGGALRLARRCS